MHRMLRLLLLLAPLFGCAPPLAPTSADGGMDAGADSQAAYTFPGCPNEDQGCPRARTFACAVDALRADHDVACTQDSDCTQVVLGNDCLGISDCGGIPIHKDGAQAFAAAAQAEVDRYCGPSPGCRAAGICPATVTPACKDGHCRVATGP